MTKPIISFDVDGVLAGGRYLPSWDRTPSIYSSLPILDPIIPAAMERLVEKFSIYIISSRRFPGALAVTRNWLLAREIPLKKCMGLVVVGNPADVGTLGQFANHKLQAINAINPTIHIDDDPRIALVLGAQQAVFFRGGDNWPGRDLVPLYIPTISTWTELVDYIDRRFINNQSSFDFDFDFGLVNTGVQPYDQTQIIQTVQVRDCKCRPGKIWGESWGGDKESSQP